MKGLILKDLYVLVRQMRFFLLFIIAFSIIPGSNMTPFAVVYGAMMPYTALAYDERSKWDQLAGTMPYSPTQLVVSKYVLGWLFISGAAVLAGLAGIVERAMGLEGCDLLTVGLSVCVGLLMMSLTLPLMFRFGVERGRMFFILLLVGIACGGSGLISGLVETPSAGPLVSILAVAIPVVTIACTALSIPLSIRAYLHRN